MAPVREPQKIVDLLEDMVVGREILVFEVLGMNALKTVHPGPDVLAGSRVLGASFDAEGAMRLNCGLHTVVADFARTGGIEYSADLGRWRSAGRSIPPTGRLLLQDGGGVDFKEPGRTKRITFAIVAN